MKSKAISLTIVLSILYIHSFSQISGLSGKVLDARTQESLSGAILTLPDLRSSSISNTNGNFIFKNIPIQGRFLIEVRYIGYKTITQSIELGKLTTINFEMQPSVMEAQEVVVTGTAFSSDNRKNSTSVAIVNKEQLINRPAGNLIDAISKIPGVSQITTGGGISKPVIRGLSSNRVVTLVDGAKQEGQQWGDEHGIEVDQYGAERVEILRGAASLLYGSDALGGVINILDPIPSPDGQIRGELISNYSTNNGLTGNSAMIQGNNNGFIWRARASYKNAFSYNTPNGRIANTGFNESNLGTQIGFNKKWGFTHLNISSFKNNIGLPDFERNPEGQFQDADGTILSSGKLKHRKLFLPFQNIRHNKVALNSNILLGKSHLHSTISYQNNQRRELEDSRLAPSLFFDLKTYSYDFKYYFPDKKDWEPVIGLSGAFQNNKNKAEELLIPDYKSTELGVFAYSKKSWLNNTFNFGARFDTYIIEGKQMLESGSEKFNDFNNNFSNISGAIGFTHEFNENFNFKTNLGSAFRAPNIAELSSDGIHEGTFRYEIGNNDLKPEKSYYGDVMLEYNTDKVRASLGAFSNNINNYIYYRQNNNETINIEDGTLPLYRFVQDNASLNGIEASLTLHPEELIHLENSFSITRGVNMATNKYLPFMPAAQWRSELRLEPEFKGAFKMSYFSIGIDKAFAQNRVDEFELPTTSYTLANMAIGTTIMLNAQPVRINIAANNLFNIGYYDHLSRFKPGRLDYSKPASGYFNQGINFALGLYLPIIFKK